MRRGEDAVADPLGERVVDVDLAAHVHQVRADQAGEGRLVKLHKARPRHTTKTRKKHN